MRKLTRSQFLQQLGLGVSAAILAVACGSQPSTTSGDSAIWTVGTEPAFPPFEYQEEGGELVGFDIDLMRAIGEKAGKTIQFDSLPFDGLIPSLQAGTIDAAISGMTITQQRAQTVSFSRPYFRAGLAIAVSESNTDIQSFEDLKDKRIAVQIGTTGASKAAEVPGAQISTFDSAPLALQELANGNVDAVINDAPVTLDAIASGNIKGLKVISELVTEEFYGIALPKDSPNVEAVNAALGELIADGAYATIYEKWFGSAPIGALPESAF